MDIIGEIIVKKPCLEAPLRFYEKSVLFLKAMKSLRIPSGPGQNAYPPELTGRIMAGFLSVF